MVFEGAFADDAVLRLKWVLAGRLLWKWTPPPLVFRSPAHHNLNYRPLSFEESGNLLFLSLPLLDLGACRFNGICVVMEISFLTFS